MTTRLFQTAALGGALTLAIGCGGGGDDDGGLLSAGEETRVLEAMNETANLLDRAEDHLEPIFEEIREAEAEDKDPDIDEEQSEAAIDLLEDAMDVSFPSVDDEDANDALEDVDEFFHGLYAAIIECINEGETDPLNDYMEDADDPMSDDDVRDTLREIEDEDLDGDMQAEFTFGEYEESIMELMSAIR